ncbi:LPD7 domain-containing protein [Noviherbaspirillum sp. Root189]|uniref:LPD7 domain-containing protein n=1 Tax=Noviherbaspirillum sp. Root189 TaxID=1736487 RepID=UPI00070E137E|nr:LPD7 domain-containing protein [Noviherbaspirillum sp. Root189]KRB83463.1 hypothetical protein ASE07_23655 [Noviherbaspirillum sp. Root189]
MIARQRGGRKGIVEYLKTGKKAGRPFTRDELDERVPLAGDIDAVDKLIKTIRHGAQAYIHVTLSFSERDLEKATLAQVAGEYMDRLMPAFRPDEYTWYAEAHLARIKAYTHETTGEHVDRLDHIHIIIPNVNLLNGKALDPIGRGENNIWLDAIQEDINRRWGFVSPKDRPRADSTTKADIISRDKVTKFRKGSFKDVKAKLEQLVIDRGIATKKDLVALAKEYGEVKIRNQGRGPEREYVAIKPTEFDKWVNLSSGIFRDCMGATPRFISEDEKRQVGVGKRTDADLDDLLEDWTIRRQREIKLLNSGRKKEYQEYKAADPDTRLAMLSVLEWEFYKRWDKEIRYGRDQDAARPRRHAKIGTDADPQSAWASPSTRAAVAKQNAAKAARGEATTTIHALPSLHQRRLVSDGPAGREPESVLPGVVSSGMGRSGAGADDALRRPRTAGGADRVGPIADNTARNMAEKLALDHQHAREMSKDEQRALIREIKRKIDPHFLLAKLAADIGLRPEDYIVVEREGGATIRHKDSKHNLAVTDFLCRHCKYPWPRARDYLQACLSLQKVQKRAPITPPPPNPDQWRRFQRTRLKTRSLQRLIEREAIRAAKDALRAIRAQHQAEMQALRRQRLTYAEFKKQRSLLKIQAAKKEQELLATIRAHRARIEELDRADPARNMYRGFLMERAMAGDPEALMELRRQRIEAERRAKRRGVAIIGFGVSVTVHLPKQTDDLSYSVRKNGDVSFFNKNGVEIMRDTSDAIYVMELTDDTIELALIMAQKRFGNGRFDPLGDDAFNERVVKVAAERGLAIRFKDQKFNDRLEQLKKAMRPAPLPGYKFLQSDSNDQGGNTGAKPKKPT